MGHSLVILICNSFLYTKTSNFAAALLPYQLQIWPVLVYQYVFTIICHTVAPVHRLLP